MSQKGNTTSQAYEPFSRLATGLKRKVNRNDPAPWVPPQKTPRKLPKRDAGSKNMNKLKPRCKCRTNCLYTESSKDEIDTSEVIDLTKDDDDNWSNPKLDKFDLTKDDTATINFDDVFTIPVGVDEKDSIDFADTYFVF